MINLLGYQMNIHVYVNGKYLFSIKSNVKHENVKNENRDYIGVRGSEEMLSIYKEVEKKLGEVDYGIRASHESELSSIDLDETNISEYLAKKYPGLERLELRADDDSYTSRVSNTVGKQYGYPLVWLNCNKYNFPFYIQSENADEHQWERCLIEPQEGLDKIGSLIEYFREHKNKDEQALYQGRMATLVDCLKNSTTDNLLLQGRPSNLDVEILRMKDYHGDEKFAFYENSLQATYITTDIKSGLADILKKKLFDKQLVQHLDDFDEIAGGSSIPIKILSPIDFSNEKYSHVTMQSITLTMVDGKVHCDITLYEGLLSDPFRIEEQKHLEQVKLQVEKFLVEQGLELDHISTRVNNMKLQLPLQTHCGRFVMTWMAAEVAGIDITRLSNYNEPITLLFGKVDKVGKKIFPSGEKRVLPGEALDDFKEKLAQFLKVRQEEFKKQYFNTGKEEIELTRELIVLLGSLQNEDPLNNLKKIETNVQYLNDPRLIKIINEGMANLGYGSLQSFIIKAKRDDFQLSSRDSIEQQYYKIDQMTQLTVVTYDEDDLNLEEVVEPPKVEEDDLGFFAIEDIDGSQLATSERNATFTSKSKGTDIDLVDTAEKNDEEVVITTSVKVN